MKNLKLISLKTYFCESENPLKGLCMNRKNITITRDYEAILMFYGYDIGMDMVSTTMPPTTNATKSMTSQMENSTIPMELKNITTDTTIPPTDTTTTSSTITTSSTTSPITTTEAMTTTFLSSVVEETTLPATQIVTSTETPATEVPTTDQTTTEQATTEDATTEDATTEAGTTVAGEAEELVSAFVAEEAAEPLLRIQKAQVTRLPNSRLQAPRSNYLPQSRSRGSSTYRNARQKRNLLSLKDLDANLYVSLLNPEALQHALYNVPLATPATAQLNFPSGYEQLRKQHYNTDVINHVFYLGQQELVHTTYKVYNSVLYYRYYEQMRLHALELELDTPQYNLLILLPDYQMDLVSAAAALRLGPTLKRLRQQLKPRWVQAIIPDFQLEGNMYLTNDLQNLGICDIFEPNRADFRPMTEQAGVYVKHIKQSISVHIRTHPINQLKRNYGQQTQPIQLSVNHPFLFFIIDRDLDVAVMAGRVLNPLNIRIQ